MGLKLVKGKDGKFVVEQPVKKEGTSTSYDPTIAYIAFDRSKLSQICKMLGFVSKSETDKGKRMQEVTVATQWIKAIVEEALAPAPAPTKK